VCLAKVLLTERFLFGVSPWNLQNDYFKAFLILRWALFKLTLSSKDHALKVCHPLSLFSSFFLVLVFSLSLFGLLFLLCFLCLPLLFQVLLSLPAASGLSLSITASLVTEAPS
jgi:hypothetical protein